MCSTANVGNPPHRGSFSLLSRRIDDMAGRGGDHPMSSEELSEKFDDCARRALPKHNSANVNRGNVNSANVNRGNVNVNRNVNVSGGGYGGAYYGGGWGGVAAGAIIGGAVAS